jgi:cation:H+ antiporter
MLGASALLIPFVFLKQNITKVWGVALTLFYAVYIVVILT